MYYTKLAEQVRALVRERDLYALNVLDAAILDEAADALQAAESIRDSAWADGYNKAISQRLAASGSIEGNF